MAVQLFYKGPLFLDLIEENKPDILAVTETWIVDDADKFVCCGDFKCAGVDSASISLDLQTSFDAHGLK